METTLKSQLTEVSSLNHEISNIRALSTSLKDDIQKLRNEISDLGLEKRWCFDKDGKRTVPTPEQEAERICSLVAERPECRKDLIMELKKKKTWLQMEVSELEETFQQEKAKKSFEVR